MVYLKKYRNYLTAKLGIYNEYMRNAKKREIAWALTYEDVFKTIIQPCHYCGVHESLRVLTTMQDTYSYNGIDRVDNTKGYEKDNIVPCCKICNCAKNVLTIEQFREWILRVHKHYIERDSVFERMAEAA